MKNIAKTNRNITILDWDDTILPITWCIRNNKKQKEAKFIRQLDKISEIIAKFLEKILNNDKVYIITNSKSDWVQISAKKFLPQILPYLSKIKIISAASIYESQFPDDPVQWKYQALMSILSPVLLDESVTKNIIAIGDSPIEREAFRNVVANGKSIIYKNIKFLEDPSCKQLQNQLELMQTCYDIIHKYDANMDLQFKVGKRSCYFAKINKKEYISP